ncbi:uncharacterized protein BXZ73DRAFT_53879, partial [Epithele typhae]|uniref:uncharacterized protein n=1 Tax=Epithele typhae TaxID=378194 RepID=UPI0020076F69
LDELNGDVIALVVDLLDSRTAARSLAATCKRLREHVLPVLYRDSRMLVRPRPNRPSPRIFQQHPLGTPALSAYVRSLVIEDSCPRLGSERYMMDDEVGEPSLCDSLDLHRAFNTFVSSLPQICSITFTADLETYHGLSYDTIRRVLTIPTLRHFTLERLHFSPLPTRMRGGTDLSPLSTFNYHKVYPFQPGMHQSESQALSFTLSRVHKTLETLRLMGASAPVDALRDLDWPRLTTLVLHADPPTGDIPHAAKLFTNMPNLRVLALNLQRRAERAPERAPIWPPGHSGPFPWPKLERLVVACPNARDEVYAHLPPTLRELALRYWKLVWCTDGADRDTYHGTSTTLDILRRCNVPTLERLEIEYVAENKRAAPGDAAGIEEDAISREESVLLGSLATAFPRLEWLTLLRHDDPPELGNRPQDIPTVRT